MAIFNETTRSIYSFINGQLKEFSAPFVRGVATHGTGCTYSAAITAGLASGLSLEQAIGRVQEICDQINRATFPLEIELLEKSTR